jgi:PAS domain S-box-containing protein
LEFERGETLQGEYKPRRKDGSSFWVEYKTSAIFDEKGGVSGYVAVYRDITARKQMEGTLAREQEALYKLTDQLQRTDSLEDVFSAALDAIMSALQCDRASILLFDDMGPMRFVAWYNLSDSYRKFTEGHSPWKPDEKNPKPISINDIGTAELSDSLKTVIKEEGIGSLAFIPLVSNGKLIGKFMAYFNAPHMFSAGEADLSMTIARQLASGIDRKRADKALLRARQRAEATADRMARLQKVTSALSETLTTLQVAEIVVDQGAPALGAVSSTIVLLGEDGQTLEILHSTSPESITRPYQRLSISLRVPVADAVRSGQPVWIESRQQYLERYPHLADQINTWGHQAAIAIPMVDKGRTLGVLTLSFDRILAYTPEDQDYILTLARQGAQSLERARAEEALRQSEERFALFMQHLPGLAWIKDIQGRYVYANTTAERAFSTPPEKLYGKTDQDIFPPEVAAQFKKNDERALMDGKGVQVIETLEQDDGVLHYSLVSKFPIPGPDGNIALIGGTAFDITELKRAEEALREHQQQLQVLNETLEQKVREQTAQMRRLATDLTKAEQRERHRISHILHDDLQQRLYAIQMQMTFLRGGLEIENLAAQRDLTEMKEQLDEILAVTRHLSIDLSPPILHDEGLAQAISWLASQMQEQHGLRIELDAEGSFAIPDEEMQVLLFNCVRELLFNIVKHAGVNQATVALRRSNADIRIEVRDAGKGFNVAAIAQPNIDNVDEDKHLQKSFGLPTLQHRLSLFGGHMDIKSEPGSGTVVSITIPINAKFEWQAM